MAQLVCHCRERKFRGELFTYGGHQYRNGLFATAGVKLAQPQYGLAVLVGDGVVQTNPKLIWQIVDVQFADSSQVFQRDLSVPGGSNCLRASRATASISGLLR